MQMQIYLLNIAIGCRTCGFPSFQIDFFLFDIGIAVIKIFGI